jgi:Ca-activated chloride channel homolog
MSQHRARKTYSRWRWLPAVAALLLLGSSAVVLTTVYGTRQASDSACPTLRVVTARSFAPILTALAPVCSHLEVTVADGRAAAARAAALDADLWIPDDASWRGAPDRLALAQAPTAGAGTVVATSPFYFVTDTDTAARIGKAGGGWGALAGLVTAPGSQIRLVAHDPGGSGDGLLALGAIGEAVWLADGMDASADALAVAFPRTRIVADNAAAIPDRPGEVGLLTERELRTATTAGLSVIAPADHTAQLRYSWFPSAAAAADPERTKAFDALRAALGGPAVDRLLAATGLRRPDGDRPPGPSDGNLPPVAAPPFDVLGPHHVDHVLATAYAEDRRADVLVAVDVSGSMRALVPPTNEQRIGLVRRSVTTMAQLLPDDARLSLWEFGTHLDGDKDYRVLRPPADLTGDGRKAVDGAIAALTPTDTGTGLHDTILAAYRSAQAAYRDGTPSHAVVFTDGRNEADNPTLSLDQLRDELTAAADPHRPVSLAVITFGDEPDAAALQKALDPVQGYVDRLTTADQVGAAFIHVAAGGLHG